MTSISNSARNRLLDVLDMEAIWGAGWVDKAAYQARLKTSQRGWERLSRWSRDHPEFIERRTTKQVETGCGARTAVLELRVAPGALERIHARLDAAVLSAELSFVKRRCGKTDTGWFWGLPFSTVALLLQSGYYHSAKCPTCNSEAEVPCHDGHSTRVHGERLALCLEEIRNG